MPFLEDEIARQADEFDDLTKYVPNARRFHEALVVRRGNEPVILLIGALELIWSAHESSVWTGEAIRWTARPCVRRCAHLKILDAIKGGNAARAVRLVQHRFTAARSQTLAAASSKTIEAKNISAAGERVATLPDGHNKQ